MLTLTFNVELVKAEPRTWTVDDDGPADFHTIQEAIDSPDVADRDTVIVLEGTYAEGQIDVHKSLTLTSNGKVVVDGLQQGSVFSISANNVTLDGFTVKNSKLPGYRPPEYAGIYLNNVQHCNIIRNNLTNNYQGIYSGSSHYNIIANNTVTFSLVFGVFLEYSHGNLMSNNTIMNSGPPYAGFGHPGVVLSRSNGQNILQNCRMDGIWVHGVSVSDFVHDIDTSNTVYGKPVYYLVNKKRLIINSSTIPNVGFLALVNSTNVHVKDLDIKDQTQGVLFAHTKNSVIENVTVAYGSVGIEFFSSTNNTLKNNRITVNWRGIQFWSSQYNEIIGNVITDNKYDGIKLNGSPYNKIVASQIEETKHNIFSNGIYLSHSSNSMIVSNDIKHNQQGIRLWFSSPSFFYHNNFINNKDQVTIYESYNNNWNSSYPSGGNYWSDYGGNDTNSGPYQNETGSDGIGDTPYIIDESNQDNYPLMNPWRVSPEKAVEDLIRDVESMNLQQGIDNSLDAKLDVVLKSLEALNADQRNDAINKLYAFINEVEAQRGNKITDEQADYVISEAQRIIDLIKG